VTSQQVSAALDRERAIAGSLDGQIADVRAQITRHHQQVDNEPVLIIIIITTITEDTRETTFLFQRLSMALQRGNAVSFHNTMVTE